MGDGIWTASLSYRDAQSESKRRVVYGKTQAEARSKLRDVRQRLDVGAPVKDAKTTVAAWLADWTAKALLASDRKQATRDLYATVARVHLVPTLGHLALDRLRPSDVEALVVAKRQEGLSGSTVRTIYTVLRAALDVAVRDGLVRTNVAAAVKRPVAERREAVYLDAAQAQRLLEALAGERLEPLFRFLLGTGLRRGEALALRWADVELEAAVVRVRGTLGRTSTGLAVGEPKTEKSRRTVTLPRSSVEALRAQRVRQVEDQVRAGRSWSDEGFVFTTEVGTLLEPRNVLRRFQQLAAKAGLEGAGLHTLRHSAASFLLAAGTHTKVVQEHLGHSSYAITADIYSHVAPAQAREAADRLDAALDW